MYKRIVVPLDGSAVAAQALPYAKMMATTLHAPVTLVAVVESPEQVSEQVRTAQATATVGILANSSISPDVWEKLHRSAMAQAKESLEQAAAGLRKDKIDATIGVLEGSAPEKIMEAADKTPDSLIGMWTHGRSGLGRWVMGSVTDKVVHHAKSAVLVMRASEKPSAGAPAIHGVVLPLDGS